MVVNDCMLCLLGFCYHDLYVIFLNHLELFVWKIGFLILVCMLFDNGKSYFISSYKSWMHNLKFS